MKYNYHPINGDPSPTAKNANEYQAEIYGDIIACSAVKAADLCIGPLNSRERESLYREYFRRGHSELLRRTN